MEPWTSDDEEEDEEDPAVVRRSKLNKIKFGKKAHWDDRQERLDRRLRGVNREALLLKDLCHVRLRHEPP